MNLVPDFHIGVWNGWLPMISYLLVFGFMLLLFPKEVIKRLYDRSLWTKKQKIITIIGKIITTANLVLIIISPLSVKSPVFIAGLAVMAAGITGMTIALINYRNTPLDQPVTSGIYRISRNPQIFSIWLIFLGICLTIGSGISLILYSASVVFLHNTTLAEEKACLRQYGDAYRAFMDRVPRYFVFF